MCGTCGRHGFAGDSVASSDTLPQTSVIFGCCSRPKWERVYVAGSAISFGDDIASVGVGSTNANGLHNSSCKASSSHWSSSRPSSAQFFRLGGSHPPLSTPGGASYADLHHVRGSDLTLSLSGVVYTAWLDDARYSLPPTLYIR